MATRPASVAWARLQSPPAVLETPGPGTHERYRSDPSTSLRAARPEGLVKSPLQGRQRRATSPSDGNRLAKSIPQEVSSKNQRLTRSVDECAQRKFRRPILKTGIKTCCARM